MTLSFQIYTKALYSLGAGLTCLKLLRSFMFPVLKQGVKSVEELGSASIKPRTTSSLQCPCRGAQGRRGVHGEVAVQAGKGEERAVFGSHRSILLCILAVTVAKSRCLETDRKAREESGPTSFAFRGKKIIES